LKKRLTSIGAQREGEMLLGRKLLVAEEDHAMLGERLLHLVPLAIAHRADVDTQHLGAASTGQLADLDRFVSHGRCLRRK
jgi:hypothetical protein